MIIGGSPEKQPKTKMSANDAYDPLLIELKAARELVIQAKMSEAKAKARQVLGRLQQIPTNSHNHEHHASIQSAIAACHDCIGVADHDIEAHDTMLSHIGIAEAHLEAAAVHASKTPPQRGIHRDQPRHIATLDETHHHSQSH